MSFKKKGYRKFKIFDQKKVNKLRKKFIEIFNLVSINNNYKKIKEDKDIIDLYHKKKNLWIAAYDQLRMLPDIYLLLNDTLKKKIHLKTGVKFPSLAAKPIVRVVMPGNIGTSKAAAHIDYPTYLGSKNAITIWIPLQKIDNYIGPLKLVPGSHKRKIKNLSKIKNGIIVDQKKLNEKLFKSINVNVGEALIFSHHLVHKSTDNFSEKIRFSIDVRLNDLRLMSYAKKLYYLNEKISFKK